MSKEDNVIHVSSIVSSRTKDPIVVIEWGRQKGQLTAQESRQHALHILEAAESAEHDSLLCEVCEVKDSENGPELALLLLRAMRAAREWNLKDTIRPLEEL